MSHGVGSTTSLVETPESTPEVKPIATTAAAAAAAETAAQKKSATAQAAKHTVTLQLEPAVFEFFAAAAAADERSLNQFLARKLKALKQSEEQAS